MIRITTQTQLRERHRLTFCYLCGQNIDWRRSTRDHAPAKSIFAESDRTPPLILPTHGSCNNARSEDDRRITQVVRLLHRPAAPETLTTWRFIVARRSNDDAPVAMVQGPDMRPLIWRWVSAFHAALYQQHIPIGHGTWQLHLPVPTATRNGDQIAADPTPPMRLVIVEQLKRNFLASQFDQVSCYNGKCDYRCVWVRADRGEWLCMFGLRIYEWERLGSSEMSEPLGCVGCYAHDHPSNASLGTSLDFPLPNSNRFDPFSVL